MEKKTDEELKSMGLRLFRESAHRGYVRVADRGWAMPYKGKYGEGMVRHMGPWKCSNQYHTIQYWVK